MSGLKILALAGGVGGAKMAHGLAQVLQPEDLTIVVNTADDFTHLGFKISPDLDTVCYTLAGFANPETGWGLINETWNVYNHLKDMGMPDWFQLGDSDLATHIIRTKRISEGWSLSKITQDFCRMWDIHSLVLPMSDEVIQTWIFTDEGDMEFQEYFVHRKCNPAVKGIKFVGSENSKPAPGVLEAIEQSDAVMICPSNPWVSIDPILSVPGIRTALESHLVIAVSPIIGSQTVKGPAAKMFIEFGIQPSVFAIAQHYGSIIDGLFVDHTDECMTESINLLGIRTFITDILMRDQSDRGRLAKEVIEQIKSWEKVN
jgi:LPPG:FO 2-phospho-L-lactate transferase